MFDFFKPKLKPEIGIRLVDKTWGRDWNEIEIIAISNNKKEVKYRFVRIHGEKAVDIVTDPYVSNWKYGILENYRLLGE